MFLSDSFCTTKVDVSITEEGCMQSKEKFRIGRLTLFDVFPVLGAESPRLKELEALLNQNTKPGAWRQLRFQDVTDALRCHDTYLHAAWSESGAIVGIGVVYMQYGLMGPICTITGPVMHTQWQESLVLSLLATELHSCAWSLGVKMASLDSGIVLYSREDS